MKLLAPMMLWFAAALPVVVLFYLLKRRRVARLVSSTVLWQRFLAENQANAPFQRLRHNWLLVLQLLLLSLAIFALARPFFSGQVGQSRMQVVILDGSASMQATDESPSRFEKARSEALALVDGLRDEGQMVVLLASSVTEVLQSATGEKAALRRALNGAQPADSPTRLKEALRLADTLTRDRTDAEIHLFSDGAAQDLAEFENKGLRIQFHREGTRRNNLGILSLDVKPHPEDPQRRAIFTSVGNFSTNRQSAQVELWFEGRMVESKTTEIAAGGTEPLVFATTQSEEIGVFRVRLGVADDLETDNEASVVSVLPQPVKVLLVSRGNRFLERALRAVPSVQLTTATDLSDPKAPFDFVILDDVAPSAWPDANVLAIHVAQTNWFAAAGSVESPTIVDWRFSHPLLRFVKFDNVQVAEAWKITLPTWATALVEASDTPLILTGEVGRFRVVWVGFDVLQSTWPLRVSFPIFVANAVEWLNPASARASQLSVQAGTPFRLPLPDGVSSAEVKRPDGTTQSLTFDPGQRELVFGGTGRRGTYQLRAGTNTTLFCVSLLDAFESDTGPREELKFGERVKVEAATSRTADREFWRWIAAAGLFVLMFEWWYYHRRTA